MYAITLDKKSQFFRFLTDAADLAEKLAKRRGQAVDIMMRGKIKQTVYPAKGGKSSRFRVVNRKLMR